MDNFAENLKLFLEDNKISGSELGRRMGLSRQAISTVLSGKAAPTLTTIENIAKAIGVKAFYLLMRPEERARWDGLNSPSTIEKRLEALESHVFSKAEEPEPVDFLHKEGPSGYLLPEFEKLAEEIERELNVDPKEKRERKKGNG